MQLKSETRLGKHLKILCILGSACFPFFGVVPEILDEEGKLVEGEGEGYIVFKQPWPGKPFIKVDVFAKKEWKMSCPDM